MFFIKKFLSLLIVITVFFMPSVARADNLVDALNLSPFVPMVLDALMMVATGMYEFFVGDGNRLGIIYVFIWSFFAISIALSLTKMYLPKSWVAFLGFSGGGELSDGSMTPAKMLNNIFKSGFRAVFATVILLQLKPVYMTNWVVNPFLEFGAVYTNHILESINGVDTTADAVSCPNDIVEKAWLSEDACKFLTQPVADLSHVNNKIIKNGFDFLLSGLRGLMVPIPHGGEDLLNIITGLILIVTFVGCNIFMALLVIQGIFNFGIQLVLYPFYVLSYVFKQSDKWFDIWPAFSGITKAVQQLLVTMIACAFILCINVAIIKALFQWNSSVFVVAAGGSAISNVPQQGVTAGFGFGQHSVLWLSAIMTFYLMFKIFDLTRKQLDMYVGKGMDTLYNNVVGNTKTLWGDAKNIKKQISEAFKVVKGK